MIIATTTIHEAFSVLGIKASCRNYSFNLAIILWYQYCYHLYLQMRNPRHVDCMACPRYTDNTHRSWDFSLLCISLHSHWTHFFLRSVHHSYTSYMFIFNCLIEFCCTMSQLSHPFDPCFLTLSYPFPYWVGSHLSLWQIVGNEQSDTSFSVFICENFSGSKACASIELAQAVNSSVKQLY